MTSPLIHFMKLTFLLLILLLTLNCPNPIQGTAVSREADLSAPPPGKSATGNYALWLNASWDDIVAKRDQLAARDLRLVDIETVNVGGRTRYSGVWHASTAKHKLWKASGWDSFKSSWERFKLENLRLVDFEVFTEKGVLYVVGVWLTGRYASILRVDMSYDELVKYRDERSREGYLLIDVEPYVAVNGKVRYTGLWMQATAEHSIWNTTSWDEFYRKYRQFGKENLRLIDLEIYKKDGRKNYLGIWRQGDDAYKLWRETSQSGFLAKRKEFDRSKLRLVDLEVDNLDGRVVYSGVWRFGIPIATRNAPSWRELRAGEKAVGR